MSTQYFFASISLLGNVCSTSIRAFQLQYFVPDLSVLTKCFAYSIKILLTSCSYSDPRSWTFVRKNKATIRSSCPPSSLPLLKGSRFSAAQKNGTSLPTNTLFPAFCKVSSSNVYQRSLFSAENPDLLPLPVLLSSLFTSLWWHYLVLP